MRDSARSAIARTPCRPIVAISEKHQAGRADGVFGTHRTSAPDRSRTCSRPSIMAEIISELYGKLLKSSRRSGRLAQITPNLRPSERVVEYPADAGVFREGEQ